MSHTLLTDVIQQCNSWNVPYFPLPRDVLITSEYLAKTTGESDETILSWAKSLQIERKKLATSRKHWYSLYDWAGALGYENGDH